MDYEMASAHATEFSFSRFNAAKGEPTSTDNTDDVIDASSIERVADPATEAQRRRLSEAPCPPPAGASSPPSPAPSSPPSSPSLPMGLCSQPPRLRDAHSSS